MTLHMGSNTGTIIPSSHNKTMTLTSDPTYGLKHLHHDAQQPQQNNDPNQ